MGLCLSCLRPQEEEDPNSETLPLLENDQVLQQKQRDMLEREELFKAQRIQELESLINKTRDVLIDSNNLMLEQSYSSIGNGNLPKVVKKISSEEELTGPDEVENLVIKLSKELLFMDLDKLLTTT